MTYRRFWTVLCIASGLIYALALAGQSTTATQKSGIRDFEVAVPVRRVALVIGAEHYEHLPRVPNALNDARRMELTLRQAGFSFVRTVLDPKEDEIYDYVKELVQYAGAPEQPVIVVFFFAGHGFQNTAINYIVPVDSDMENSCNDAVPVSKILSMLATHFSGLTLLFFDSCRTGMSTASSACSSGAAVGFNRLAENQILPRAIIGLASKYNAPAFSYARLGDLDSPYTTALATFIPRKGLTLGNMFDQVQTYVEHLTNQSQSPDEIKGAGDSGFFFVPDEAALKSDLAAWEDALATNQSDCIKWYVDMHPDGLYVQSALQWMANPNHINPGPPCPRR